MKEWIFMNFFICLKTPLCTILLYVFLQVDFNVKITLITSDSVQECGKT